MRGINVSVREFRVLCVVIFCSDEGSAWVRIGSSLSVFRSMAARPSAKEVIELVDVEELRRALIAILGGGAVGKTCGADCALAGQEVVFATYGSVL